MTVPLALRGTVEEDCRMTSASFSQERVWLDDMQNPALALYPFLTSYHWTLTDRYNVWSGLKITGAIDIQKVLKAILVVVEVRVINSLLVLI